MPPVVVSGFNPSSGPVATSVVVTGSGFTGATSVLLAGKYTDFQVLSDTMLSFFVPPQAGSGTFQVTAPGGTGQSATPFTVTWPALAVADTSVTHGPAPTVASFPVTLTGSRLTPVTVSWATADGTALAGVDYQAATGVLELPVGTNSGSVQVNVLGVPPPAANKTFQLHLTNPVNAVLSDGDAIGTLLGGGASRLVTLNPCRFVDTRNPDGPRGGPALAPFPQRRLFVLTGACGIPATATAVVGNVTTVAQGATGNLKIYPGDLSSAQAPPSSAISFSAGKTRANNAILKLASDGTGSVAVENVSTASTHILLDVAGYLQ